MNITDLIKQFSILYKKEVLKPHSKELMSYKLLVNQLPLKISEITSFVSEDFILKGSIGSGVNTYYPWFGIFDKRVSSGATNGFYLVLLFSNDFNDIYLTFNQGATIQSQTLIESNRNFVYTLYNKIDGFEKGQLPEESLVKIKTDSSSKNGKKYQETNIFYKKYEINELDEKIFLNDFNKLLNIYIY